MILTSACNVSNMTAQDTQNHDRKVDPLSDPAKLAMIGAHVRRHLDANSALEKIETDLAEIYRAPRFLTRRDCAEIMRIINSLATPSPLYDGVDSTGFRTSYTHYFAINDPLTRDVENYISDIVGIDDVFSEPMQGQRYQQGQEFRHHHDFFHVGEGYWQEERLRGGQRSWTAMICLKKPREGGETDFPHLECAFRPEVGEMLIWNNMRPDGRPNMKTLHAGKPVVKGIKHIITKWYRQEPWRIINAG